MKHIYLLMVGLAMTGTIWAQTVSVTLSVDMNSQDVAAEGVHVAGNFQGWAFPFLSDSTNRTSAT